MIDRSESGMAYNRFRNLESIEDRIIYYLLSPTNKSPEELRWVHTIWKLLMYNDIDALNKPLPKYSDVIKLIQNDNISQADKRIFRSPHLEEGWEEQCSMLKIYVDTIIPKNHIWSIVNIGIDVLCHDKIINVKAEEGYEGSLIDEVDGIKWLPIEEIPNYNWAFNHKSTLLNEIIPKLEEYYHNYVLDTIKVTYE